MEHFSAGGVFWLPDTSGRRVPGELVFDADGARLVLHDSLEADQAGADGEDVGISPQWRTFGTVHGQFHDGRRATLLDVAGMSLPGPFDTVHEDWSASFALLGDWADGSEFGLAMFSFDALLPWADPPGIASQAKSKQPVVVDGNTAELAATDLPDGTLLRLLTGASGQWDHAQVRLEQWCSFEATGGPLPLADVLRRWVRPMQDLLIVCLGRPVRLVSLHVALPGAGPQDARMAVYFSAVQPAATAAPTAARIGDYNAPTLVTGDEPPVPLPGLLRRWCDMREEHLEAVTLLCGPLYAPFIYGEHRYASTFQAAEALAKKGFDTKDTTKMAHKARVAAVRAVLEQSALDPDVVTWAGSVIEGRNDKPLWRLIEDLTGATGPLGEEIMAGVPDFPRQVAGARTGVSHGGAGSTDALRRHWLGELLTWVLRVHLLGLSGVPVAATAGRALAKPRVKRAIEGLAGPV